jgi:hypothetical protein
MAIDETPDHGIRLPPAKRRPCAERRPSSLLRMTTTVVRRARTPNTAVPAAPIERGSTSMTMSSAERANRAANVAR